MPIQVIGFVLGHQPYFRECKWLSRFPDHIDDLVPVELCRHLSADGNDAALISFADSQVDRLSGERIKFQFLHAKIGAEPGQGFSRIFGEIRKVQVSRHAALPRDARLCYPKSFLATWGMDPWKASR